MLQRAFGILCGGYRFELSCHRIYGLIGLVGISCSRVLTGTQNLWQLIIRYCKYLYVGNRHGNGGVGCVAQTHPGHGNGQAGCLQNIVTSKKNRKKIQNKYICILQSPGVV
jgi:hypothetical protein